MQTIEVRYSKAVGAVLVTAGVVLLILVLVLLAMGARATSGIVVGPVVILMGIGYLVRPYFLLEEGRLTVPALIGPFRRRYTFDSGEKLVHENGRLYLCEGDLREPLPVRRLLANRDDWARVVTALEG